MVYLVGDNNLSEEVAGSLAQLRSIKKIPKNIKIFSFFDGGNPMIKAKFFNSDGDGELIDVNALMTPIGPNDNSEVNSADKQTLINFVAKCKELFQADEYVLIISAHGDGFLGRTLMSDENPGGNMTVQNLKAALDEIKGKIGNPLSILGFDSCLMNMLEIGYEFRDNAEILLTSQANVPTSGWNYKEMLSELIETGGSQSAEHYAGKFVESFIDFQYHFTVGGRSVEISANRLKNGRDDYMEQIAGTIHRFGNVLQTELNLEERDEKITLLEQFYQREIFRLILESHCECQTMMYDQAIDIKDFCQLLYSKLKDFEELNKVFVTAHGDENETPNEEDHRIYLAPELQSKHVEIKDACRRVIEAVDYCVIAAGFCGAEQQFSKGISVFFPWTCVSFFMSRQKYEELTFAKNYNGWKNFLEAYLLRTLRKSEEKSVEERSNPRYSDRGMDGNAYLHYFSRAKNFDWDYRVCRPRK